MVGVVMYTMLPNASSLRIITPAAGLDHLLVGGRGAGGSAGAESEELHVACFMGLVSYLASRPQTLRVAPYYRTKLLNAVARSISQSATITETPLTSAGLSGSGEVIQVIKGFVGTYVQPMGCSTEGQLALSLSVHGL